MKQQLLFPNVSVHGHSEEMRCLFPSAVQFLCLVLLDFRLRTVFLRLLELHLSKQICNIFCMHVYSINFYHKHFRKGRPKQIQVP